MDLTVGLDAPCPPGELFSWVDDLERYPAWLGIVDRAVASEPPDDGVPVWTVDLSAQVGPFSRSKRLRMVRTDHLPDREVRFERRELDGRQHGSWVLRAEVAPRPDDVGSRLTVDLHYDGRLWGPVLEPVLADEIERSRRRLLALVTGESASS